MRIYDTSDVYPPSGSIYMFEVLCPLLGLQYTLSHLCDATQAAFASPAISSYVLSIVQAGIVIAVTY